MPGLAQIALPATAIALAVVLGACGARDSAAKNDYVKEVNAAQTQFANAATRVEQQITKMSSAGQDRRALDRFASTIDTLVARLRAIKVPGDVRAEHGRLVAVMADHGEEVLQITATMRSATTTVLEDVQRKLSAATITVNANLSSATASINAKLRAE
jgi:hypothetical protein